MTILGVVWLEALGVVAPLGWTTILEDCWTVLVGVWTLTDICTGLVKIGVCRMGWGMVAWTVGCRGVDWEKICNIPSAICTNCCPGNKPRAWILPSDDRTIWRLHNSWCGDGGWIWHSSDSGYGNFGGCRAAFQIFFLTLKTLLSAVAISQTSELKVKLVSSVSKLPFTF